MCLPCSGELSGMSVEMAEMASLLERVAWKSLAPATAVRHQCRVWDLPLQGGASRSLAIDKAVEIVRSGAVYYSLCQWLYPKMLIYQAWVLLTSQSLAPISEGEEHTSMWHGPPPLTFYQRRPSTRLETAAGLPGRTVASQR